MRFLITRKSYRLMAFLVMCTLFNLMLVACSTNQAASSTLSSAAQQTPTTISAPTNTSIETTQLASSINTVANPSPQTPPEGWQTRWLRSIPCKAPCWEGITPGVTTVEEATKLLKHNPLIDASSIATQVDDYDTNIQILDWKWIDKIPGGEIYYVRNSLQPVIKEIRPYYDYDKENITLNTVIQLVGQPNYILATGMKTADGPPAYGATLLFTQQGLSVDANNMPKSKPLLEPAMLVTRPSFFIPQQNPSGLGKPYSTGSQMWQGFKDFNFYCRDADQLDKACT